jgi:hypothetical protein
MLAAKECPCPQHEGPRMVPASEFYADQRTPTGLASWCKRCAGRYRAANRDGANQANRAWSQRNPASKLRAIRRRNAATLETATRYGQPWTGPELETASREDLTAAQIAVMIGRTRASVARMRSQLRKDPRTIALAGIELETGSGGGHARDRGRAAEQAAAGRP